MNKMLLTNQPIHYYYYYYVKKTFGAYRVALFQSKCIY